MAACLGFASAAADGHHGSKKQTDPPTRSCPLLNFTPIISPRLRRARLVTVQSGFRLPKKTTNGSRLSPTVDAESPAILNFALQEKIARSETGIASSVVECNENDTLS